MHSDLEVAIINVFEVQNCHAGFASEPGRQYYGGNKPSWGK